MTAAAVDDSGMFDTTLTGALTKTGEAKSSAISSRLIN